MLFESRVPVQVVSQTPKLNNDDEITWALQRNTSIALRGVGDMGGQEKGFEIFLTTKSGGRCRVRMVTLEEVGRLLQSPHNEGYRLVIIDVQEKSSEVFRDEAGNPLSVRVFTAQVVLPIGGSDIVELSEEQHIR